MNSTVFSSILCLVVSVCWAAAPLISRMAGSVNAMMMAVLIAVGTLVAAMPVAFSQNYLAVGWRSMGIVFLAGIANGVGLIAFYRLVAGSGEGLWELSKILPIAYILVPIVIAIGARVFYGEAITSDKVIGIALACGAIWFLK